MTAQPHIAGASPETSFLLAVTGARPVPATAGLDWPRLVQLARIHHVLPNLGRLLQEVSPPNPDAVVLRDLKDACAANASRNIRLAGETLALLDSMAGGGIRAIPFKGPVLAADAYGDVALRQFDDLDFMVHPDDLMKAIRMTQARGWPPHLALREPELEAYLRAGWDYSCHIPSADCWIELGSSIGPAYFSYRIDPREFWTDLGTATLEGRPVPCLSPPALLVLLCLHGNNHAWERIQWVADVAAVIRAHPDLDWNKALARAGRWHVRRAFLLGMELACRITGIPSPPVIRKATRGEPDLETFIPGIVNRWGSPEQFHPSRRERLRFHLATKDCGSDRLLYLARLALTPGPRDWRTVRLPRPLFFLYRLIRPFRIAIQSASR